MGAYLSEPKVECTSDDGESGKLRFGSSAMQGWRLGMEDGHNCILNLDDETAMFAVYDGHGGAEVAIYCSKYLPDYIRDEPAYKDSDLPKALEGAFMKIDAAIKEPSVVEELKHIAGMEQSSDEADAEEANALQEEANLPLGELLARYSYNPSKTRTLRKKMDKNDLLSPMVRKKPPSFGAGGDADTQNTNGEEKGSIPLKLDDNRDAAENMKDSTPEDTPADTPVDTPVDTPADTPVDTPADTPVDTPADTPVDTPAETPKDTPTDTHGIKVDSDCAKNEETDQIPESSNGCSTDSKKVIQCNGANINGRLEEDDSDDSDYDNDEAADEEDEDEDDDDDDSDSDESDDSNDAVDNDVRDEEVEDSEEDGDKEQHDVFGQKEEPGSDSGCTAVVALIRGTQIIVANAGDSRCVLSNAGKAVDLSIDHKPEDKLEITRIERAGGQVTADGRVNGGLNLSRAIGDHCYKCNADLPPEEQMISAYPDIQSAELGPDNDIMVAACDGIWNVMSSQEVINFVRERIEKESTKEKPSKLSEICEELFHVCLAPDTSGDGTGCDNMTCVIVQFNHGSPDQSISIGAKRKISEGSASGDTDNKRHKI